MTDIPAPLVPPEVDLRDFAFMPLDVLRLRDSDLSAVASGDAFKAAVLLWCASWHQLPAGSVPDDERWLAKHSGAGSKWPKVRDTALRGFQKCSDGRLYHAVVAQKAVESWSRKVAQRQRTKAATEARERQRNDSRDDYRNVQRNDTRNEQRDVVRDADRNVHQGTGTGTGTVKGQGTYKPDLEVSKSPTRVMENVKDSVKKFPSETNPESVDRNRRIAQAAARGDIELARRIKEEP